MPLGSLVESHIDFENLLPDFMGGDVGPIDPRQRLTVEDLQKRRKGKKARRKYGEFEPLVPGQELEIRGFNEFQDARRRAKQASDALVAEANKVGLGEAVSKATREAGETFDVAKGSLERRQRGLGLRLSERQQRSQGRRVGLARSLSRAQAAGSTRRGFARRATIAKRGGVGLEAEIAGTQEAGLIQLTNAASQSKIQAEGMIQAREESRAGFLGGLAGMFSSEDFKHDKREESNLLERLKGVRVQKWKYVGDETDHIGPYAEEFNDTFGVGQDDKQKIAFIDMLGVTLGAVKELSEQVDAAR